jgi:hypothetical protein
MDQQSIEYSVCTARDTGEMTRMLAEVFSSREPPAVAVGLTRAEFESFVQLLCPNVVSEGLTIARDPTRVKWSRLTDGRLASTQPAEWPA